MSKKTASLLVGLLAIAEGHSEDRNLLSEANRDDVLNVISPELLDNIAKRLYAEDDSQLSAYERLLKDDKKRKMDYLNNVRQPDYRSNDIPALAQPQHVSDPRYMHQPNMLEAGLNKLYYPEYNTNDLMGNRMEDKEYHEAKRDRRQHKKDRRPPAANKDFAEDAFFPPNRVGDVQQA
jgi:hypothetical protein